ncbi:MAG: hypothetical protein IPN17_33175 [Deltaproteobacteria bacterium]|nr:hypothetical protein [Deltaproteobacteria bacterium]
MRPPFEERVDIWVEELPVARGHLEGSVRCAVVHQAEEHQQPRPRTLPLLHGVGEAGDVLAQLGEEPRQRIRGLVDGITADEPAILGVEHEDQPQEHREHGPVDLAGRLAEHVAQQPSARRIVGCLEAP